MGNKSYLYDITATAFGDPKARCGSQVSGFADWPGDGIDGNGFLERIGFTRKTTPVSDI